MNIAFIEYETDIDDALKNLKKESTVYVSVSAQASYNLLKKKTKFLTDEEILTPQEFQEIGNENFEFTKNWVQQLEQILKLKNPIFAKMQFTPFKWHFYRLKILLDAVRIRHLLITRLIEKEKPLIVGSPPAADPKMVHDHHLFFHVYDSLYGVLVKKIAIERGLGIKTWDRFKPFPQNHIFINSLGALGRRFVRGLQVSASSFENIFKHKTGNILIGNLGYDIEFIKKELSGEFNFYYYRHPLQILSLNSFLRIKAEAVSSEIPKIKFNGIFEKINVTGDPIVDDILGNRIQRYAEKYIPILWHGLHYLKYIDSQKEFKAYIHPVGASDAFYGLPVFYFEHSNRPVITVQHGAYGFALNRMLEYCEFAHNGYFLSWGEGIREQYDKRKQGNCNIVSTGSYLIEKIKKDRKIRRIIKKVCYVPGSYRGYTAYYPNGQPGLDSKLFLTEVNFLMALKPYLKKYQIIYKVSPGAIRESSIVGKNPMISWLKENIPSMHIESRPLLSLIHDFDLFIIDFPSTTLIQALASGAEVLVYVGNPYYSLSADGIKLLGTRAVIGLNEGDFKDKIISILDKGTVVSNVEDVSFLKKYGTFLNDGNSLKRMTEHVVNLCSK
jgi:hypothetical protein